EAATPTRLDRSRRFGSNAEKRLVFGTHFCETGKGWAFRKYRACRDHHARFPAERLEAGANAWITPSLSTRPGCTDPEGLFRTLGKMPSASIARKRCACQPTRRASFARSGP